jgi:hypothetical protein
MYKVASDGRQKALRRGKLADWAHGEEHQSPADERRNVQAALHRIDETFRASPNLSEEERAALIARKTELQKRSGELRAIVKKHHGAASGYCQAFIDAAKELLPAIQFKMIHDAAWKNVDAAADDTKAEGA